jgi:hypothetical protein
MKIEITINPADAVPCLIVVQGKVVERPIRLAALEDALWALERIINDERQVTDGEQITIAEWSDRQQKEKSCAA